MRGHSGSIPATPQDARGGAQPGQATRRSDWQTLRTLLPYLWAYRWRVLLALVFLVTAKFANVAVPIVLKHIVDALTPATGADTAPLLAVPVALIIGYGLLRLSTTLFTELREIVFIKVTLSAVRTISLQVFRHLHALSLRFHLERQTGGLTRDIERGSQAVGSLVSYTLYSIVPTLVEISLVLGYLVSHYDRSFVIIAGSALLLYIAFTISVTEWRTHYRRQANELDTKASSRAVDSLLNFETVKYFNNEAFEAKRYEDSLMRLMRARGKTQMSLALLNLGQSTIIALAVTLMVWRAVSGVVDKTMSLGDLVLVNAFMIQLYIPLNFLGVLYREIKQSLTDLERMFRLLEQNREIADAPDAKPLQLRSADSAEVRFDAVDFSYDAARPILRELSFTIAAGTTTAVVGASGAGKSTLARLLFRFYDVDGGRILIDGQDIRSVTQSSLRQAIGIVPQDTVLFNDTIGYNIAYGRPGATQDQIAAAARAASLDTFIASLPDGYDTRVGERGLKLSGGEKQRVAIARMLLKNPPVAVLDEATSALDTRNERAIQGALDAAAADRTTLVIAHRLSTIVNADQIVVLDAGRIAERGTHVELLERNGLYAQMWAAQAQEAQEAEQVADREAGAIA